MPAGFARVTCAAVGVAASLIGAGPATAAAATAPKVLIVDGGVDGCPTSAVFCYRPPTLSVHRGTKVTWANASPAPHTVTRCTVAACGVGGGTGAGAGPASGTLLAGGTYKLTFTSPGTYVYYCRIHGYAVMHGTVAVTR